MPAPQTEAAAANDAMDIIVTARRREERLQDVPVAVTAVTGQNLAAANIFQVQDIQQTVPGLTIQSSARSEEHTSELQSLMRISYAVFCLKKKNRTSSQTRVPSETKSKF